MNHSQMGLGTGKEEKTKMTIEKESDDLGHFWVTGTGPEVFSFPMPLLGGGPPPWTGGSLPTLSREPLHILVDGDGINNWASKPRSDRAA